VEVAGTVGVEEEISVWVSIVSPVRVGSWAGFLVVGDARGGITVVVWSWDRFAGPAWQPCNTEPSNYIPAANKGANFSFLPISPAFLVENRIFDNRRIIQSFFGPISTLFPNGTIVSGRT
jgi:hypothetical protein